MIANHPRPRLNQPSPRHGTIRPERAPVWLRSVTRQVSRAVALDWRATPCDEMVATVFAKLWGSGTQLSISVRTIITLVKARYHPQVISDSSVRRATRRMELFGFLAKVAQFNRGTVGDKAQAANRYILTNPARMGSRSEASQLPVDREEQEYETEIEPLEKVIKTFKDKVRTGSWAFEQMCREMNRKWRERNAAERGGPSAPSRRYALPCHLGRPKTVQVNLVQKPIASNVLARMRAAAGISTVRQAKG